MKQNCFSNGIITTSPEHTTLCPIRLVVLRITDKSKNYYDEMFKLVQFFNMKSVLYVNILIEPIPGNVLLFSYNAYGRCHCGYPFYPIKIDEFNKDKLIFPKIESHYDEKTLDFHSCELRVGVLNVFPSILKISDNEITGLEGSMLSLIAKTRNFKMNFTFLGQDKEDHDYITETDKLVSGYVLIYTQSWK